MSKLTPHGAGSAQRPKPSAAPAADAVDAARDLAIALARECADSGCADVLVFDVTGRSTITRFVVIASGTSDRQLRSTARDVGVKAAELGYEPFGNDEDHGATWVVVDLIDAMVHVFEPGTRSHYDLESLHAGAPQVDWQR